MPAIKNIRSVIFDFDYTLADSSSWVIECVGYALSRMNLPVPSSETICRTIGLSLLESFRALTGASDKNLVEDYGRLFVERADQVMLDRTVLFDSVKPTIKILQSRGLALAIVSTKFHYRIKAFLRREKISEAFQVIVGGEDVQVHKPDPSGLYAALDKLKCLADNAVYVGDSTTDAETARRASIPFIAVLTGVTAEQDFHIFSPQAVISDLKMLPGLIT
jgi:phosphoglycolate phosphatase